MKRITKNVFVLFALFLLSFPFNVFPVKTLFASTPVDISQTNVENNKFTVSWVTESAEICQINYGPTPSLGKTAYDDRGKAASGTTHHVTINGLAASTQYYYEVVSGGQVYRNNGQPYAINTAVSLTPPSGSHLAYGQVLLSNGDPAAGAIVFAKIEDNDGVGTPGSSQTFSVLTDNTGWWNIELSGVRTQDLTNYFTFSDSGDGESVSARIDKFAPTAITIDTAQDHPASTITLGWFLNMTLVPWYQNQTAYYTGAAACQMILNYIREGASAIDLTQDEIYNYAHTAADSQDLNPAEVEKALGHFDPYDTLISNSYDTYDSLPAGNPYQGYNFGVEAYSASDPDAFNNYMRDICHWMAFTVTQEEWWKKGALVARPNSPAAVPIYGDTQGYNHWVAVIGAAASNNPNPDPLGNPWNTPDFTIYGLWINDPLVSGMGKNKYITAVECQNTYFKPLNTSDAYNGMYIQVAEPPSVMSEASAKLKKPEPDRDNVRLVKAALGESTVEPQEASSDAMAHTIVNGMPAYSRPKKKDLGWKNIIDPALLADEEAVKAFEDTHPGAPILVERLDVKDGDYYIIQYHKKLTPKAAQYMRHYHHLTAGVIIIDAKTGSFKEASWDNTPADYIIMSREDALQLVQKSLNAKSDDKHITAYLVWQPGTISSTPYKPFWKIVVGTGVYYVSQEGNVSTG